MSTMTAMKALRRFFTRCRNFVIFRHHDARLREEIEAHIAIQTEENLKTGMNLADARRQAILSFGAVPAINESYHAESTLPWVEAALQDARYAMRKLRKSPSFTAIATISLALAIGANTTIFSVARQILYQRLAVPHASDLRLLNWTGTNEHVAVHHIHGDHNILPGGLASSPVFSYPAYQQLRTHNGVLSDLIAFRETGMNATIGEQAEGVLTEMVSENYYPVLGIQPQLGRAIGAADDTVASPPVAIISDGLWDRDFNRSPTVLGQSIKLNDVSVTIIGVNPKGFTGAKSTIASETPDVTVPLALQPILTPAANGSSWLTDPNQWWVNILGRSKPGVSNAAAQSALNGQLSAIVRATMPLRKGEDIPRLEVLDGSRGLFEQEQVFAKPLSILMLLVGLVLLLACANIANLMLARTAQRKREMSVRIALGAGRGRIVRQMLIESLMLALLGGLLGLAIGYFGRLAFPGMAEDAWQKSKLVIQFDWPVFAFTALITLFTGILFGMAPALAAARAEVNQGLKEGAQTATRQREGTGGKLLVGFQIALSTVLVIGAGLFLHTLARMNAIDPGFLTHDLLVAEVPLAQNRYPAGADIALHQKLEQAIAAIPGVEAVSPAMQVYLSDDLSDIDFVPAGESEDANKTVVEPYNAVGTHFFQTMGIPILAGRSFGEQDTAASPKVGIINQALAKARFPGQNPLGRKFTLGGHNRDGHGGKLSADQIEIVGICGDTLYTNLRETPPPQFFIPYVQQSQVGGMSYVIRTRVKPESVVPVLRRAVHAVDPDLPLVNLRTQDQQIDADLQQERLFMVLTSGFGILALLLASIKIYGVMSYTVAQRTNEFGIRLALGATRARLMAIVLSESSWIAVAGVTAGLTTSFLLGRFVRSMLYGIAAYDPITLLCATILLLVVASAASWIPALRAANMDPLQALRAE
jgi:predicted permease